MKSPKPIAILENADSPWVPFLSEVFSDIASPVYRWHETQGAGTFLDEKKPVVVFAAPSFLSPALLQKLKAWKQSRPDFRLFQLGPKTKTTDPVFDDAYEEVQGLVAFQKRFVQHLPLPEKIRVLVIDDEQDIGDMMKEFLEHRSAPAFEVEYLDDGHRGLQILEEKRHDVLVLDIKMPVLDGREIYRTIKKKKIKTPVIIFFDAISGEELPEVRKYGNPAVVEKGGRESAMPEMIALIKKLVYFG